MSKKVHTLFYIQDERGNMKMHIFGGDTMTKEVRTKEHAFLFMWWVNWKSWGFAINFVDGLMIQILCFYFEIDREF